MVSCGVLLRLEDHFWPFFLFLFLELYMTPGWVIRMMYCTLLISTGAENFALHGKCGGEEFLLPEAITNFSLIFLQRARIYLLLRANYTPSMWVSVITSLAVVCWPVQERRKRQALLTTNSSPHLITDHFALRYKLNCGGSGLTSCPSSTLLRLQIVNTEVEKG